MSFDAPHAPTPSGAERELLLGYIRWKREQVVATANGLDEEGLRWTPKGRLLPIIGIINHLAHMEWRWIEGRYGGAEFPPREQDEFVVASDSKSADLIEAYWQQAQRTESIVRAAPNLDLPCVGDEGSRGPVHVLFGYDEPVTLRWVLLHVLEETAHHAGHADSTREMLDGKKKDY